MRRGEYHAIHGGANGELVFGSDQTFNLSAQAANALFGGRDLAGDRWIVSAFRLAA